jgi:hypothetical protein
MLQRLFRKTHRWLGLIMAAQIIAWMASGLVLWLLTTQGFRRRRAIAGRQLVD